MFLSSYSLTSSNVALSLRKGWLFGIPDICMRCKNFEKGWCASPRRKNLQYCSKGLISFVDEENDRVIFGCNVVGRIRQRTKKRVGIPLAITEDQFFGLMDLDRSVVILQNAGKKMEAFSTKYNHFLAVLRKNIPTKYSESETIEVKSECVLQISNAIDSLAKLRQDGDDWIDACHFSDMFMSNANHLGDPLFPECERCVACADKRCRNLPPSREYNIWDCARGLSCCSYKYRAFYGIRQTSLGSCYLSDAPSFYITDKALQRLIENFVDRGLMVDSIKRFLHDVGQYISGIQDFLSLIEVEKNSRSVMANVEAMKSMLAMTEALDALHQDVRQRLSGKIKQGRKKFQLYNVFHKYKRCFSKSAKVKISTKSGGWFCEWANLLRGFEAVVLNVMYNAVKYLPPDDRYREVQIEFEDYKEGVKISIYSYGPPVSASDLPKIGTAGFRSDSAIKMNVRGQGLGMSAVKQYSESAGINVNFSSAAPYIDIGDMRFQRFTVRFDIPRKYIVIGDEIG